MGRFYQDHEFYYLSGVSEPNVALLLAPATGDDILFVPPFNRFTAQWDGERLAPGEEAARRTGFKTVGNSRALERHLAEALKGGAGTVVFTLLQPAPNMTATPASAMQAAEAQRQDPFDGRPARHEAFEQRLRERFAGIDVRDLSPWLDELRVVKTEAEIAAIRAASEIAAQGIAEAMKSAEPGIHEFQLAAAARYTFDRLGAGPDAYAAIVGAGPNGCVLHYSANTRKTEPDDLVVMDYAPTVNGYCADVTRTFPVSGKFTPEQRKLVQDVYEIQQELISHVKPGASLMRLHMLCSKRLTERGYQPAHGPCHHVGLAVHDPSVDVLKPGMVITVEPGAYLQDKGMGCRIEDTVLVTEDGCINLSGHLPADPGAIEALMQRPGVQQVGVGMTRE